MLQNNIVLYGAGRDFHKFIAKRRNFPAILNDNVDLVVDSDKTKWGTEIGGYLITSPVEIDEYDVDTIVITSSKYYLEIKNQLETKYPDAKCISFIQYWEGKIISYQHEKNLMIEKKRDFDRFDPNSLVVYTAIIGNYDELRDPEYIESGIKYVCYTDQEKIKSDVWEIRKISSTNDVDERKGVVKKIKMLPHLYFPEYKTSIWMDASMKVTGSLTDLLREYQNKSNIMFFPHMMSICIYDIALGESGRDSKETILRQIVKYYQNGFPLDYGLFCGGFIVRNHNNKDIIKLMEDWYREVIEYSWRDQISLPYVIWDNDISVDLINDNIYKNNYFNIGYHKEAGYIDSHVTLYQ